MHLLVCLVHPPLPRALLLLAPLWFLQQSQHPTRPCLRSWLTAQLAAVLWHSKLHTPLGPGQEPPSTWAWPPPSQGTQRDRPLRNRGLPCLVIHCHVWWQPPPNISLQWDPAQGARSGSPLGSLLPLTGNSPSQAPMSHPLWMLPRVSPPDCPSSSLNPLPKCFSPLQSLPGCSPGPLMVSQWIVVLPGCRRPSQGPWKLAPTRVPLLLLQLN